jgi:hypothetical protein
MKRLFWSFKFKFKGGCYLVKMYGQGFHLHEGHAVGVIKDENGRPMRVHNNKVVR